MCLKTFKQKNRYLEICELDPAHFLSTPAALKNKVKLDLLIDINMTLMEEKVIRDGICHAIYPCAEFDNKYMKNYDKNKDTSYLKYWDVNNLYGCAMSESYNEYRKLQ